MAERISILNDPPQVLEGPDILHRLISFEDHKDSCAIDFTNNGERGQYSYNELRSCVAALVLRIQKILAADKAHLEYSTSQHIIPVLLPQSPGLYISQLAILESGGAFCPINLDSPKERIKFVVGDVSASLIITTSEFERTVSWEGGPMVILVDKFPIVPAAKSNNDTGLREPTSRDLAYVMYTSGSSGTPKGVAVSHLAVSQSLLAHERHIPSFNRFLQFAAPSFDVSVFEIFFPLIRGSTLVGCNRSQLLNDLPGMINKLEVDAAELTPTVVGSLLQKRSNVPNLKLLLTIGEMLTRPIIDEFGGSDTKESLLYGMYGPTEAAIHCTIHPKMATSAKHGNIGVPLDTVSTFIAATNLATNEGKIYVLPMGELGELVLGGSQLAQGYLNREEQNKAAFVHAQGKEYYRTGDKARMHADGSIEILGRISAGQVKLRGQRVELGEIEEAVYKRSDVKTATAVVLGSLLILFALVDDEAVKSVDLLNTCSEWLPKFMVPSEIVLLQNFPYLPSGKVDKRKLESDYRKQRDDFDSNSEPSSTRTEQIVKETLQDLVGAFSGNTRLAAAGVDSLVAIQVVSRLRFAGFDTSTVSVLRADTLDELVRLCDNSSTTPSKKPNKGFASATKESTAVLNGSAKDVESTMACTPLQSAMLSETTIYEQAYRNWVELELPGVDDSDHVIGALHALADHNPILRTGFGESRDSHGFVQILWKTLAASQIIKVQDFNYHFDKFKDSSLLHPLRVQVRHLGSSIKLLIHLHHALYDAWSLELLLDDLNSILMELSPISRPSFAKVVDGYLDGTLELDSWASHDYWRDHLSHLDLRTVPNFHSGEAVSTGLEVAKLYTSIPTTDVETAAKRLYSSPQSIFQAAYALILSSYLGSSDLCFGTVFSGRTLPIDGIEDIVGPCLATLPVRVDISISTTLQDLVQELNATNRKHLEHSTVPLRKIKYASGVNPRRPLFDTLIIWQQTLHKYDHTRKHVSLTDTMDNLEFNLTLEVVPGTGNIELRANYLQSLFPRSQIDMLLQQVEQVALIIIRDETTLIENAFRHFKNDILSVENKSPKTTLKPGTLASPVERIANEYPNRPAIEFARSLDSGNIDIQKMTYSELNSRANQIGQHLLTGNLLPDELVCICMEKSVDLYASILATAKVSAGYLPVTPDTPSERLQHILREAGVRTVMAESSSRPLLNSIQGLKVVYIDEVSFTALSSKNIPSRSSPENISYCVFTSGSTGTPKGVLVTQGNLLSNLDALEDIYPATHDSRLLQSCSQAFDVSAFEIFFTWRIGGCLCSATKDVLFRDIENAIRVLDVTHLSLTPTVAALIDPKNVPKVQFLVTAGEAITQTVFNAWVDKGLHQAYGPSETTNVCTVNLNVSSHDAINNIGHPLRNTSAFVLFPGPKFALVPRGGEGEFSFGGSQVFRGYMDRNQDFGKIVDHPTYGRIYRSGDFGRLMPDGSLAFTGRKDDQVKIRGQRVELGEINNVMLRSKDVRDCVTVMISEDDGSQRLVCFWTSYSSSLKALELLPPDSSTLAKLYKMLQSSLPVYMIPSALIPINHLPSTSQGKIDKRLLVKHYKELDVNYLNSISQVPTLPSSHTLTDLEFKIAMALEQCAKVPLADINQDTSFFNVGIDSISAIAFSRILHETTKCQVEISDILKYQTVWRLAERISSREQINPSLAPVEDLNFGFEKDFIDSTVYSFRQAGKFAQSVLPCTPLQEAMLSAAESSSERIYNNRVVLDVSGSVEKLRACWQEMVRRHEILRTCFITTDMPRYAYAQVVLEKYDPIFSDIDEVSDVSQIIGIIEDRVQPSQFKPPYSFHLLQSSASTKLLISMHHALYDGVALTVLYQEVENLYHNKPLPPPVSFSPFLQYMVSMKLEEADQFWDAILKGCAPTKLSRIYNQPTITPQIQSHSTIQLKKAGSPLTWIEKNIKKQSTSLLALCHATWASILSERLEVTDVCFGNVVNGRAGPIDGIERLVAPCFNTIPARLQDIHKLSYLEAFRKLQTLNADSLPFQLTPLRRIQSKFSQYGSRLFDTLFILQQPPRDLDPSIWSISEDNGVMDFPLVCEVVPKHSEDTLEINLHSHPSFISIEDASAILDSFASKIQAALENPRRPLLSSAVKEQISSKALNQIEVEADDINPDQSFNSMITEELKVRDIISSFTDVPVAKIGRDVSIFKLGLDSISAVQFAARLRKHGYSVLASDILEHPTIALLSSHLVQSSDTNSQAKGEYDFAAFDKEHREAICSKNGITSEFVEAIRPCTAVQQGMIARSLHSQGKEYVNSMDFELEQGVSLAEFKTAWGTACYNHEMLRSGFAATDDPKHLFGIVTYKGDKFSLPWFEEGAENSKYSIIEQLARCPWILTFGTQNQRTVVKLTAHHALYDAQSLQVILLDVAKSYFSKSLIPLPRFTSLLGAILRDGEAHIQDKESFWKMDENKIVINRFPDLTPLRVSNATHAVRELFSQASTIELDQLCRQHAVTMQAAGQAAWARLLTAYIGETTTTFGITLSGRSISDDADRISFPSIVTLPVRCDVTGTNKELLSRTMKSNALLLKHQFTPLASIQKWAGFPEGKIFDTLFAYQKIPDMEDAIRLPWKVIGEEATVDYEVSIEIQPTKSGALELRLTFREDLIPVEHAELLLRQYDALLLDTLQNPQHPSDIALDFGTNLLSITPAKEIELPDSVSLLHEYVERGAHDWPNKKALEFATCLEPGNFESRSWTYEQINRQGNKVAQLLVQHRAVPGQIIALCFDKCAEASFATIGILKAGCTYVALDPNAPPDRLKFIVEDSGANLILTAGNAAKNIKELMGKEIISLDTPNILEGCSSDPLKLSRNITPQDTCYCLYTSGTTGTPKGCLITHENAVQAMLSFQRLFTPHWTADSKWLQFASFHFDVSVLEQFWSWSVGICVATAPRDLIFENIAGAIHQLGITHIDLTPSLARLLHPKQVPSLCEGVFITGGEQLKQEILDVWGEYACIYNGYGPTETTIGVTMYPRVPKNGKPSNIGPQFDNVGSFVLKPGTAFPVLRGGTGELCVSGKLVGKGYLNRPSLTAERFQTLNSLNERVYRTGDLVRILHDGSFIFLGRTDDQVKLRGQRLELSEINEVIKKSTDKLQEVVTLVLKHSSQQKEQLVTFFITTSGGVTADRSIISAIMDACKARLPGYMVPTHFIPIKALPLNANNKADSKQLATMYNDLTVVDLQQLGYSSHQNKEWTDAEKRILDIVAKVLRVEVSALARDSTVFELGLDSISIIGFSEALHNSGLSNGKLSVVMKNPIMERLVQALLNKAGGDEEKENARVAASQNIAAFSQRQIFSVCKELEVESREIECIAPCTPIQEGMIYRFLESEIPLYVHTFNFSLNDGIDIEKLLASWDAVVAELQILRTRFIATDDGYAQVVMRTWDVAERLSVDYESGEKSIILRSPHKLTIKSNSSRNVMSIQIFHGLYDGNSLTMILRRVFDEYCGLNEFESGPSFHSSLAYGPLAKVPGAEKFWTRHLKDWSYHPLPTGIDLAEDFVVTSTFEKLTGFEELRKRLGVTPQAIIQAAWLSVLHAITSPVLTIGMITSGRTMDFRGADKVIGPLFNTVPFHVKIDPGMTGASLISRCHDFNMQMQDFQHTSLNDIQKWSPATLGQPLFDSLFVFQRSQSNERDLAKDLWIQLENEQTADYPLAFEATLDPDGSKLFSSIVAQGFVLTQTRAIDLLVQFENSLCAILEVAGTNIVLRPEAATNGVNGTALASEPPNSTAASDLTPDAEESRPFGWTKEAQHMRKQISVLANVDKSTVHEHSSIFGLGLDSIDVIKLCSRLKKRGVEIPVSAVIKCQTIAKMVVIVSKNSNAALPITRMRTVQETSRDLTEYLKDQKALPNDVQVVLPATPLQQSMVNEMIKSDYKRYFTIEAFELEKKVNFERMMTAVDQVIRDSPILRTTFAEVQDPQLPVSYAQIVHNSLVHPTQFSQEQNFEIFLDSFKTRATALAASKKAVFQVQFISVGQTRYVIMAISHALYDGRSLQALHEDIQREYFGQYSPRPDPIPFLEQVFKSATEEAKIFWRNNLANLPHALFPRKERSEILDANAVHRRETRSRVALKDIQNLCRSSRVTMQTLGQTCWSLVLSYLMGQLDVVFGSVLSCRESEEANQVMFPLMNTVVVRSVIHGTLNNMLNYMQDMSDSTRQYQYFPLGTAQAYSLASRTDGSIPGDKTLFDTLFIYQGHRQPVQNDPLYNSVYGSSDVEFPLCVEMEIMDDAHLSWTTACKSIARNSVETDGIIEALDSVLKRIIESPETPAFVTDSDGISVCGLPGFQKPEITPKNIPGPSVDTTDQEWSDLELKIRKALHEVSKVPKDLIRKDTTIFHLGLDSILVLKLPALLKNQGVKLSVSDILKDQTILCMAQSVVRAKPNSHDSLDVDAILSNSLPSLNISGPVRSLEEKMGAMQCILPVTAGQLYMIRMWQASQGVLFHPSFTYIVSRPIDKKSLENAWKQLLKLHDVLRTGFVEIEAEVLQVIFRNPPNAVIYEGQELCTYLSNLCRPPVNLVAEESKGVITKLRLEIHHSLYDGISLPLLIGQLQSLCQNKTLPAPQLSFRAFVAQSIAASNKSPSQISRPAKSSTQEKWTSYLNHESLYPTQEVNGISSTSYGARTEVFYPALEISPLKKLAQDSGVSIDALFLAAVSKIYAQILCRDTAGHLISEVVFGVYLANRAPFGEDLSQLSAPTVNLLPLRVRDPLGRKLQLVAQDVQQDLQKISSAEMCCASLAQIQGWCGVRVNFFVNILKDVTPNAECIDISHGFQGLEVEIFEPVLDLSKRAEVVHDTPNEHIARPSNGSCDAYLPSVDVEIRYQRDKLNIGVFAPTNMLSVTEAEKMIGNFVEFWT